MTAAFLRFNRRTFASLAHRNYRLYFIGQVVSVTGTWMQNIAMAWLILELTHSPVAVGALALCQFLPFTVFGLFAGVIVDRFDARRIVIWTQAASMILAVALAVPTLLGEVTPWIVYLLAGLRGTVLVLDAPSRQALTFQMVGPRELPNAVALNSSLFNGARVLGPALGGGVVAIAGAGFCFAFNAVSFLAVLVALLAMRAEDLLPPGRNEERPRLLKGTGEALRYVRRTPRAATVLGLVAVASAFGFNFNVLLPVMAKSTLHAGPGTFGAVTACFGGGALLGALASAALGKARMRLFLAALTGFGLGEALLAPQRSVAAAGALLFVVGFCFTLWTSNSNATLQLEAPSHLRGRVIGLYYYAFNGSGPAAGLLAGWLASIGGTELAYGVGGLVTLGVTLLVIAYRLPRPAFRLAHLFGFKL
ncbi:MAG TPA: MFS transporter [Gaiellaceae bacterium]|nr:MFS transporter [Gaiellaceae bacterium]